MVFRAEKELSASLHALRRLWVENLHGVSPPLDRCARLSTLTARYSTHTIHYQEAACTNPQLPARLCSSAQETDPLLHTATIWWHKPRSSCMLCAHCMSCLSPRYGTYLPGPSLSLTAGSAGLKSRQSHVLVPRWPASMPPSSLLAGATALMICMPRSLHGVGVSRLIGCKLAQEQLHSNTTDAI